MSIYIDNNDFSWVDGQVMPASGDNGNEISNEAGINAVSHIIPGGQLLEVAQTFEDVFGQGSVDMFGLTELNPIMDAKDAETHYHEMSLEPGGGCG